MFSEEIMKDRFSKLLCAVMVLSVTLGIYFSVPTLATTESELRSEISKIQNEQKQLQSQISSLKNDKAKQQELKTALETQMALAQKEIDLCTSAGGKIISLGKRILRTETAATTAVGMCMLYAEINLGENND